MVRRAGGEKARPAFNTTTRRNENTDWIKKRECRSGYKSNKEDGGRAEG